MSSKDLREYESMKATQDYKEALDREVLRLKSELITSTPEFTVTPEFVITSTPEKIIKSYNDNKEYLSDIAAWHEIVIRYSWYYPPYGGINCRSDGKCSEMANGEEWYQYLNKACACPSEFPFGTVFNILGEEFVCKDRGGAIIINSDGSAWIDVLSKNGRYKWGTYIVAKYKLPRE